MKMRNVWRRRWKLRVPLPNRSRLRCASLSPLLVSLMSSFTLIIRTRNGVPPFCRHHFQTSVLLESTRRPLRKLPDLSNGRTGKIGRRTARLHAAAMKFKHSHIRCDRTPTDSRAALSGPPPPPPPPPPRCRFAPGPPPLGFWAHGPVGGRPGGCRSGPGSSRHRSRPCRR
jgi:hypothetical protein